MRRRRPRGARQGVDPRVGVVLAASRETAGAFVGLGSRDAILVVLKVVRRGGDEWHAGDVPSRGVPPRFRHAGVTVGGRRERLRGSIFRCISN